MEKRLIQKENIKLKISCIDWKDAIEKGGNLLVETGYITEEYVKEMIKTVHKFGPYIVIAPHIAIAHAKPSKEVLKEGISLVTLNNPVNFGSEDNDPVDIVFSFCAKSQSSHLNELKKLVKIIENEDLINKIRDAEKNEIVHEIVNNL